MSSIKLSDETLDVMDEDERIHDPRRARRVRRTEQEEFADLFDDPMFAGAEDEDEDEEENEDEKE